jgi:putative Mn2+ efflux pump MntP
MSAVRVIENAWDEYRGWAKRARTLQESNRRWNTAALVVAVVAAVLGCASGQVAVSTFASRVLSFLAAVAAGITPILGRNILEVAREAGWIRARATAEAIKSDCFRYAAGLSDYASQDAQAAFRARRESVSEQAVHEKLTPMADPANGEDPRCPPMPLSVQWYLDHRLREQRKYYQDGADRNERAVNLLRTLSLGTAILAAVIGVAASTFAASWLAPWIGAITTGGTSITAYGLMERRQFLAASYAALASRLSNIEEEFGADLSKLVDTTENLLQAEHGIWTERMEKLARPTVASPELR